MSGNQPYAAEVKKEALQVESAKAELFKSIEDLRVLTDAIIERLSPVRDLNKVECKMDSPDTPPNFPPVCGHAKELLDASRRIGLIFLALNQVRIDLQI